jgi:TetR/AcrR family acrAB operon transcriptional repressor
VPVAPALGDIRHRWQRKNRTQMARRTKAASEQTRRDIVAAARREFLQRGVSRTSLEQIARTAGVTRGAIYWHFADKQALFDAMRDEVKLPIVDSIDVDVSHCPDARRADPLEPVAALLDGVMRQLASDPLTRDTWDILTFRCEYVEGLVEELDAQRQSHEEFRDMLLPAYRRAAEAGVLRADLKPALAATETMVFMTGLVRVWLLDDKRSMVRDNWTSLIAGHLQAMRATGKSAP